MRNPESGLLRHGTEWAAAVLLFASLASAQVPQQPPPGPLLSPGMAEPAPPLIDAVSYSGNRKISTALLEKHSALKIGAPISRALISKEIKRVVAVYRKAGLDLSIAPNIQHPLAGHVTVEFQIDENGKGGDAGAAAAGSGPPAGARSPTP
jgi:hypothetical protein